MKYDAALVGWRSRIAAGIDTESFWAKSLLACTGAYLTALSAQVVIPLPFTPIPITGQVFAIMLIAGLFRPTVSGASQGIYFIAGVCGLPWYAGGGSGYQFGPNGGFLLGFVLAAPLVSALIRRDWFCRSVFRVTAAMFAGLLVIYSIGSLQFALVMRSSLHQTINLAVAPFVFVDAVKISFAAGIVYAMKRKV